MTENTKEHLDILDRIKLAELYVKDWHINVERWRRLYDMKHYPQQATQREIQYSDPTFTNTVDLAVGIMLANSLRWHSFGFTPSMAEQKDTGKIEKLLEGIMSVNDSREERHQRFELFQNFVRDGAGIIYSVFDPIIAEEVKTMQTIPDEDSDQGITSQWLFKEVPMVVKVVDPLSFFALPGGRKRWLLMGRQMKMTILDVEQTYNIRLNNYAHMPLLEKATTLGNFKDVWDYGPVNMPILDGEGRPVFNTVLGKPETMEKTVVRNTLIFDGEIIRGPLEMPGYQDLPFDIQFFKPTGVESAKWQSILSPLESSVALLERSFNRRAYQIDVYTSLPMLTKVQPGRKLNIDPGLYNYIAISPDESIEFPQWPGNAPDLQLHMDFLRSRIQQSGFSDVMFGSGQSQIAGYALSQLGDQNRIRLEQPIKHIELLFSSWAKKAMKLLMVFGQHASVCVYGHQRGLDYVDYVDIDELEGYEVRAEIRPNFPNEEQRKVAMATQAKGMLSNYRIMEKYLGEEQPEDEQKRMLMEAVTNHPASIQYAVMSELKKRADMGDEVAAMTLESLKNSIQGEAGRPADPNKPEQLTGTQSPNGQPVPQAEGREPYGQGAANEQNAMASQSPSLME